ncbi:hypothetical protein [Paraburkholderia sediminicola]|uniref:hypothetical protein n=1 Tax=Paraburkholderia sediminicola TaxID=458836 RepID=UPI0038B7FB71
MNMSTAPELLEAALPDRWIDGESSVFRENFDRKSFEVSHHLASHPLFQLPQLMDLAERTLKTRPLDLYYDMGDVAPGQKWKDTNRNFSPLDALRQLEERVVHFQKRAKRSRLHRAVQTCDGRNQGDDRRRPQFQDHAGGHHHFRDITEADDDLSHRS